jgi:hypothetical protein
MPLDIPKCIMGYEGGVSFAFGNRACEALKCPHVIFVYPRGKCTTAVIVIDEHPSHSIQNKELL